VRHFRKRAIVFAATLTALLTACVSAPPPVPDNAHLVDFGAGAERWELQDTAYFPQAEHYSAAEALAMAMYTKAAPIVPNDVGAHLVPAASDAPALRAALSQAALALGYVPYPVPDGLRGVITEVRAGHPVAVLLNLGSKAKPNWRYAVVNGYDPATDALLLRSGTEARVRLRPSAFLNIWRAGDNWAVVTLPPDQFPATAVMASWIAASEGFNAIRKPAYAETAATAAIQHWPDQVLPWMALGNARYHQANFPGAETAYVKAIALRNDNPVAHHNLAQVLLERRCVDVAAREVAWAIDHETDTQLKAVYAETAAKIMKASASGPAVFCPSPIGDGQAPIEYDVLPLNPENPRAQKARKPPKKK